MGNYMGYGADDTTANTSTIIGSAVKVGDDFETKFSGIISTANAIGSDADAANAGGDLGKTLGLSFRGDKASIEKDAALGALTGLSGARKAQAKEAGQQLKQGG